MENKLLSLVENIFSKENLEKDKYLVSKMDARSFVDLSVISKFPKVSALLPQHNSLPDNVNILRSALTQSRKLEIEDREKGPFVRPMKQNDLQTSILPVKKTSTPDPASRAQSVWLLLTSNTDQPDEIAYTVEDILCHKIDVPANASPRAAYHKETSRLVPTEQTGVLAAVLQPTTVKKRVERWEPAGAKGEVTSWADKSARRRMMLSEAKAKGTGYNKGMMRIVVCRGPEGPGFSRGRGHPLHDDI